MDTLNKFNVKVIGDGSKTMIFAHGFGCDQNMWRFVAPAFAENYRVVLFDYIGAGPTDEKHFVPAKYSSLNGYAEDLLEVLRDLDLKDCIFVGHSVSAMIGILANNIEPERFSNLILVGPSPRYINDSDYVGGFEEADIEGLLESLESNYLGWSNAMAPVIMANSERPELGEELANSFCQMNPEIARSFARVTFLSDTREDLKKTQTPALVLQCSEDVIAPLAVGEYTHRNLKNSQLHIMKATGHCPNLSAPDETIACIKEYLQQQL